MQACYNSLLGYFCWFLKYFLHKWTCHINKHSFMFSCPIHVPFIFFCYLIELAGTSTRMLESSDGGGHPCLVPFLSGKTSSVSPLRMLLAIGLLFVCIFVCRNINIFIRLRKFSIPSVLSYYQWMWDFSNTFSAFIIMIMLLLTFYLLYLFKSEKKVFEVSKYDSGFIYSSLHSFLTHEV